MKYFNQKKQTGFTLIEISFVLLIIGLLIAGSLGAKTYIDTQKANNEASSILRVVSNLQSKYATVGDTTGVNTTTSIKGNVFDNHFPLNAAKTQAYNPFGGTVDVVESTTISTRKDGFKLTYTDVPSAVCQKLIPLIDGQMNKILINGTSIKATAQDALTPIAIDSACAAAAAVSIDLIFNKNGN